jgi:competence protein ComEC
VLKVERGASSILLTGDAEESVEAALLSDPGASNVSVLKVGHHGSKTSTSRAFLAHAAPRAAIISCGRYNRFGHPNAQVLDRLAQKNIPTLRTDMDGTIDITCDDRACEVSSFR